MSDTTEKDLGITINSNLKYHDHIIQAVNKSSRILDHVKKTFTCLDKLQYPYYTRPWWGRILNMVMSCDHQYIKIQRRKTTSLPSLWSLPYEEVIPRLILPSFLHRRRQEDMIQVFKILSGLDRIEPSFFFHQPEYAVTRAHSEMKYTQVIWEALNLVKELYRTGTPSREMLSAEILWTSSNQD